MGADLTGTDLTPPRTEIASKRAVSNRRPARGIALLSVLLSVVAFGVPCAHAGPPGVVEPWDGPAFTAQPADIAKRVAAISAPADTDVQVLLWEECHSFSIGGQDSRRRHLVYRILTTAGVEGWSNLEASWLPWRQRRPELRARVIDPQGNVRELDPATVAESPGANLQPDIFHDVRVLRAPIPGTSVGSVVEEETVVSDEQPLFDRGLTGVFFPAYNVPVSHARLLLDAPRELTLSFATAPPPTVEPAREERDGRIRLTLEFHEVAPVKDIPEAMPSDQPASLRISWATGRSWHDAAVRYFEIVDRAIGRADVGAYVNAAQGASGRDAIGRVLAAIRRDVRYSGVEFGVAAITPADPATVVKRKFGDCKDEATLLVAVLRALGREADVALLSVGPGLDVEAKLPGLGLFDHAIVVVKDDPPLWIDPTSPYALAGELPIPDQGRLALIASAATSALVRTPASVAPDNAETEARDFFLAEDGPARVVETTESTGAIDQGYRAMLDGVDRARLRERITEYVKSEYAAKELGDLTWSEPRDLRSRLKLRLEAKEASRGTTDGNSAAVAIFVRSLVQRLPSTFFATDDRPRAADYVIAEPFVKEIRCRIAPPPGYTNTGLPPARDQRIGPARLTAGFQKNDAGEVTATIRFDSGKSRLTPAELVDYKKALKTLVEEPAIVVRFEQVGEAHLAAGRVSEALSEFARLARLHPTEALHHAQRARALLAGGLGEEARREARRAIEVEPTSAKGWDALSWCLQHDAVGRQFRKGFDLPGAIAAYRKAKELEPKNAFVRANLAILLEYDDQGRFRGAHADLAGAVEEYRALGRDLDDHTHDVDLLEALVLTRRFAEAKELASSVPESQRRDAAAIAALAMSDGVPAALAEARRRLAAGEERRKATLSAAWYVFGLRAYPEAADLFSEAANGAENASGLLSLAQTARTARRHEDLSLPADDPASAFRRLVIAVVASDNPQAEIAKLLVPDLQDLTAPSDGSANPMHFFRRFRELTGMENVPVLAALDLGLARLVIAREGRDDLNYKLRVQALAPTDSNEMACYVVKLDGAFRIIGFNRERSAIAKEVLRKLDGGDFAGARTWLNWLREDDQSAGGDDPLEGGVFPRIWSKGSQAGPEAIRAAASCLLVRPGHEDEAIALLRSALAAERDPAIGDYLRLTLARGLFTLGRFEDAEPLWRELNARYPDSRTAFLILGAVDRALRKFDASEAVARERLERSPDDPEAVRLMSHIMADQGQYDAAMEWLQKLVAQGKADAADYNNLGWNALFRTGMDEQAVQYAQRGIDISKWANRGNLHTLASAWAGLGKPGEAYRVILSAMSASGEEEPDQADWYVFGRLAEAYDLPDVARELYGRVKVPKPGEALPISTFELAHRRLAALPTAAHGKL